MQSLTRPALRAAARRAVLLAGLVAAAFAPAAGANPSGPQVAHGSASFATPNPSTLNVSVTPGTIINWQQFGIAPGEVTRFLQHNAASAVLNRVVGGDPSAILGSLLSNGRVFLINPNGVVFGAGAVVDTAGLVVSTLNMTDEDFLAGRLHFGPGDGAGGIVNEGAVRAGGSIVLIAPRIENSGVIESDDGDLLLAAGREVTITSLENPEVSFALRAPADAVVNLGRMVAGRGAASVFAGTIRHSGEIDAGGVTVDAEGRVHLVAAGDVTLEAGSRVSADGARGGEVHVESETGTLMVDGASVSARGESGAGGDVRLLGRQVGVVGDSVVDASGRDGGGTVRVGGDYQGANPDVANARATFLGADARVAADAGERGDGGRVILWADDTTRAFGAIDARGGSRGGDGGFVEVSGKLGLVFDARVDTTAPAGASGTLLLDPDTIDVINGGGGSNDRDLPNFDALGAGATTISELALEAQTTNVVLLGPDGITIQDIVDDQINFSGVTNGESVTFQTSNGDIRFVDSNDEIFVAGGNIDLVAGGGGSLVNIGRLVSLAGTGGDINLSAGADIDLQNLVQSTGTFAGNGVFTAGGKIGQGPGASVSVAKLTLTAGAGIAMTTFNRVQQLTAENTTSGDIFFGNSDAALELVSNGAFAVSNKAPDGIVDVSATGDGATPLTVSGLVESPNGGGGNQVVLQSNGLLTIGPTGRVQTPGQAILVAEDATFLGPVSADFIAVSGFDFGNLELGSPNAIGNAVLELSQSDVDQLFAATTLSLGSGLTQNISVTAPVTVGNPTTLVTLTSFGQGIDFNAFFDVGTAGLALSADGFGTGDGEIRQGAAGVVRAGQLTVFATQQIALDTATNQVGGLTAISDAQLSSGIRLRNDSGAVSLALNVVDSTNADIAIVNSGGVSVTGFVDAGTGNVSISESTRDISGAGGTVSGANVVLAASLGGVGAGTPVRVSTPGTLALTGGGAGAAGNIDVIVDNAISTSSVSVNTPAGPGRTVALTVALGPLTVDSAFGNATDALSLRTDNGSIDDAGGSLSGSAVNLSAESGIGTAAGTVKTATASLAADVTGTGGVHVDNTGDVVVTSLTTAGGGDIGLNQTVGSGAVTIAGAVVSGGVTRIRAASPLVIAADITSPGFIELTTAGGAPNTLTIDPGVVVNATGAGSFIDVNSAGDLVQNGTLLSDQSDVLVNAAGNVVVGAGALGKAAGGLLDYNSGGAFTLDGTLQADGGDATVNALTDFTMGAAGVIRSLSGNVGFNAGNNAALGLLDAPNGSAGINAGGAISDANGAAVNVAGIDASLNASAGIGAFADPIETQIATLNNATTSSGDIAVANTGALTVNGSPNASAGSVLLRGSAGLTMFSNSVNAGNQVTLDGGSGVLQVDFSSVNAGSTLIATGTGVNVVGTSLVAGGALQVDAGGGFLLVDSFSFVSAGSTLNASGADIDFYSSTVSGTDVFVDAPNTVHLLAGTGQPVLVSASNNATVNAGALLVEGGTFTGDSAKLQAGNALTVNAGSVSVTGGAGAGAFASIDPTTLVMNVAGAVTVQGGAGGPADIVADLLVDITAGSVSVLGGNFPGVVNAFNGNVVIDAAAGAVTLGAGASPSGDGVIVANNGTGVVDIFATACTLCVLLASDPFANTFAEAGVFAATLNLFLPVVPPPPPPAGGGGNIPDTNPQVVVGEEQTAGFFAFGETGAGGDDLEDEKLCK